jgi:hypothetical protein
VRAIDSFEWGPCWKLTSCQSVESERNKLESSSYDGASIDLRGHDEINSKLICNSE